METTSAVAAIAAHALAADGERGVHDPVVRDAHERDVVERDELVAAGEQLQRAVLLDRELAALEAVEGHRQLGRLDLDEEARGSRG